MKKNRLALIIVLCSILAAVFVIFVGIYFFRPDYDNDNPIRFTSISNGEYLAISYEGREYLPFAPCNPRDRTAYLGYIDADEADEVYAYKGYSTDEWLVSYLNSGLMSDCMLMKEKHTTNIPDGLSSEYEWWQN